MDRLIEVKVNGYSLTKDNNCAGAQYESNITKLRITFAENWDNYAKTVTFWNAFGTDPVKRVLTTDLLEDVTESARVYIVPIPGEAMARVGWCSFVVSGYSEDVLQRTVEDKLKVLPSSKDDGAGDPADPTPSQAEQLQEQIDTIIGDIQMAATAAGSAAEAANSAAAANASVALAEKAADEAEGYSSHPPVVNDSTGYWQEWDGTKYVDTEHYSVGPQGVKGERGFRGEQGVQGIQGEIGPAGAQGVQGPAGVQGPRGEAGPQGAVGPQGKQGIQGAKGDKGDRGDKGATGDTGATGERGPQGEQGLQGIQGIQGEVGPQGNVGPAGPQGIRGETGERGAQGPAGPQGETGAQGIRGIQGVQGAQGEQGPKGDQGEVGPQGPQGIQGPEGPRGFSGVMVETAGYVNFCVTEDGILQCTYTGNEAPDYSISEDGHLILTV